MPGASRRLLSTSLTVDGFTVTSRHERTEGDLTASIAVAMWLLGTTEEIRVEGSGEGHPGSLGSLRREGGGGGRRERNCFIIVSEVYKYCL